MEWVSVAALFVAFALGVYVGWEWHRHVVLEAIRNAGVLAQAATPDELIAFKREVDESPIDHDAMFRIIKDHQGDR